MLHDKYFEEPFPINFSSDEISGFYYLSKQISHKEFQSIVNSEDIHEVYHFYLEMYQYFMKEHFKKGCYAAINNGYALLQLYKKDKIIRNILKELDLDLTHFVGMQPEDMQIIAIPFNDFDDMDYFGYVVRTKLTVDYWEDGERKEDNLKYFRDN